MVSNAHTHDFDLEITPPFTSKDWQTRVRTGLNDRDFYRAMHFSAKRGIAIACRLSVRLSVCDVGEL